MSQDEHYRVLLVEDNELDARAVGKALSSDGECVVERVVDLASALDARRLPIAVALATLPQSMRGFGHVKLASIALARAREAELLHRWDPARHPRPPTSAVAGSFKGIEVLSD